MCLRAKLPIPLTFEIFWLFLENFWKSSVICLRLVVEFLTVGRFCEGEAGDGVLSLGLNFSLKFALKEPFLGPRI